MYVGIDGGGNKTRVVILDDDKQLLAVREGGPSNVRTVNLKESIDNIQHTLQNALSKVKDKSPIKSVFIGLGDISSEDDEALIESELAKLPALKDAKIKAQNNVYSAFTGALEGREGIIVIIGTGSVAFGVNDQKESHRCGGYSFKEGDLGSAYDLGKQALSYLGKALDGRIETTPFIKDLKTSLEVHSFNDAVLLYDDLYLMRAKVARIARLVTKYADLKDPYALQICEEATDELALMVEGVYKHLSLKNLELGVVGSLGNANTIFKMMFDYKVKKIDRNFVIHPALKDPAYGAALKAIDL